MNKIFIGVITFSLILLSSCKQSGSNKVAVAEHDTHVMQAVNQSDQKRDGIVPPDEVCMANNAYMGKKQLEVKFNGKVYYGCCEMCKERIPKDASVRVAIDPYSQKQVDKALAVIAVTGDNGKVSYFENQANYANYLKRH